jgi:hypothetical protein
VRATATVESQPQPRNKHRKDQHLSRLSHCCETLQATCGRSKRGGNTSRASEGGNATRSRHWSNAVPNERSISVDGLVERQ